MFKSKKQKALQGIHLWVVVFMLILVFSIVPAAQAADGDNTPRDPNATIKMVGMLVFVMIFFYFILIRPQQKKDREKRELLDSVHVNDTIVTIGGIHGTVTAVKDHELIVRVDEKTKLRFSRSAVSRIVKDDSEQEEPA